MTGVDSRPTRAAYVLVVSASLLSQALFCWPLQIAIRAGQNAILVIPFAVGWSVMIAAASTRVMNVNLGARAQVLLRALDLAALSLLIVTDGFVVSMFCSMLRAVFYVETPRPALLLPLVGVATWAAWQGKWAAARVTSLWMPLLFIAAGIGIGLGLTNVGFGRAVIPNRTVLLLPIFQAVGVLAYAAVPLGVTIRQWIPEVQGRIRGRRSTLAVLMPWTLLTTLYAMSVTTLGADALVRVRWPLVFTLEQVTVDSAFFISRIGIGIIFGWTAATIVGGMIHLTTVGGWVSGGARRPSPGWGIVPAAVIIAGIALVVSSPTEATRWLIGFWDRFCAAYLIAEALVLFGVLVGPVMAARRATRLATHHP